MAVDNIRAIMAGLFASHATAGSLVPPLITQADWAQRRKKYVCVFKPIPDAAADSDYEWPLFHNPWTSSLVITKVTILPFDALTADDTDFRTVALYQRVAAGDETVVASVTTETTGTGDWVALTPIDMTLSATAADLVVPTLGDLSISLTHDGDGVITPVFGLTVEYYEL